MRNLFDAGRSDIRIEGEKVDDKIQAFITCEWWCHAGLDFLKTEGWPCAYRGHTMPYVTIGLLELRRRFNAPSEQEEDSDT
jgi:hypothetical protein